MGQVAARVAKNAVRETLTRVDTLAALRVDPKTTLEVTFKAAHAAIEAKFKAIYEEQGWTVTRTEGGYLVRSKAPGAAPVCVHGGTTATVVIVLDGKRLIVSNVGDSTAIIAGLGTAGELKPVTEWTPMPAAAAAGAAAAGASAAAGSAMVADASVATGGSGASSSSSAADAGGAAATGASSAAYVPSLPCFVGTAPGAPPTATTSSPAAAPLAVASVPPTPAAVSSSYMELSADHSPESPSEFTRMHALRPHASLPLHPELQFVYDTLSASKLACPPIFTVDPASGTITKTERGSYYKNVRCEWATLVATPPHAPFQDALAFTRSLGDLHLQTWGVSHTPETWWMDITTPDAATGKEAPLVPYPLALTVCSDGIWDNWRFEEVAAFILAAPRIASVARTGSAQDAANELMVANMERAKVNFGSSADNMTAVTMYLFPTGA